MLVSEEFPSQFMESAELKGKEWTMKIARVEKQKGVKGRDGKLFDPRVIYFEKAKKGFCVNKTNAKRIRDQIGLGDDMEQWIGHEITIYPTTCNAFGNPETPCIRVKVHVAGGVR